MEVFLPIFVKHPLTPRMNGHSYAQVMAEAYLEGLLPMALESMVDSGSHGDRRLGETEGLL